MVGLFISRAPNHQRLLCTKNEKSNQNDQQNPNVNSERERERRKKNVRRERDWLAVGIWSKCTLNVIAIIIISQEEERERAEKKTNAWTIRGQGRYTRFHLKKTLLFASILLYHGCCVSVSCIYFFYAKK